jgi:predicted TIM-barrel fold metal-dependent hydrolase
LISVTDAENENCAFICTNCGKVLYRGFDPFRTDNLLLLQKCEFDQRCYPFLYFILNQNTIQRELDYFSNLSMNQFFGIKFHPDLSMMSVAKIHLDSTLPVIIHCGTHKYSHPMNAIEFARHYEGNVLLAHWGRFDEETLKCVKTSDNLFIDTSPTFALELVINRNQRNKWLLSPRKVFDTTSQLFDYVLKTVGSEKIVFGSDIPWSSIDSIQCFFESLNTSDIVLERILRSNFHRFLGQCR